MSSTIVVETDAERVQRDLNHEEVALGAIFANGLAPIDDADIDLRPADFSNPALGNILRWLRQNHDLWQHGLANTNPIHVLLDGAGLIKPLGLGAAAVPIPTTPAPSSPFASFFFLVIVLILSFFN